MGKRALRIAVQHAKESHGLKTGHNREQCLLEGAGTGIAIGLAFAMTMLLCVWTSGSAGRGATNTLRGDSIRVPLRDPTVLGMGALTLLTGFAMPCFGRMLLYLGSYVVARSESVPLLLTALTLGQVVGVLAGTALAHRFATARLLAAGHAVSALGLILFGCDMP